MKTFDATTTASEVVEGTDLTGVVVVVTGCSGGIGLETVRALLSAGATVVAGNRPGVKSDTSEHQLREEYPNARLEVIALDLGSLNSVRAFATEVLNRYASITLLINNAGIMAVPYATTDEGFESQIGTNHIGHFVLTNLLLPALLAGAPSRIVNLSSSSHFRSDIHWDDPMFTSHEYEAWPAYSQSKTANILFTKELDRRYASKGLRALAVHPGVISTDLSRSLSEQDQAWVEEQVTAAGIIRKTPQQGASTTLVAALDPELGEQGGSYLADCVVTESASWTYDSDAPARLWALTESWLGESFPVL
jgi:NAD(P)-dependent dehydrogenase (short-subunit alcohol dehydrogenase family)